MLKKRLKIWQRNGIIDKIYSLIIVPFLPIVISVAYITIGTLNNQKYLTQSSIVSKIITLKRRNQSRIRPEIHR